MLAHFAARIIVVISRKVVDVQKSCFACYPLRSSEPGKRLVYFPTWHGAGEQAIFAKFCFFV